MTLQGLPYLFKGDRPVPRKAWLQKGSGDCQDLQRPDKVAAARDPAEEGPLMPLPSPPTLSGSSAPFPC